MRIAGAELVLGADIGATSTRMVVTDLHGRVVGTGRGGPGNPNAVGLPAATAQIRHVLTACLRTGDGASGGDGENGDAELDPGRVVSAVVGMAGSTGLADRAAFVRAALPGVSPGIVRLVPDFAVAFAAGTPEPAGYVVLSGTGAGAVQIEDDVVTQRRDAWGWLLGDAGSAFWLGREAVRATLEALQRQQPAGPLGREVLRRTGSWDLESLIATAYRNPPIQLAELAPAVSRTAGHDPAAADIVERAAESLLGLLLTLDPVAGRPVVTTGSVLGADSPVRRLVAQAIGLRLGNPVIPAGTGLAGALWLALQGGSDRSRPDRDPAFHHRVVGAVSDATPA